MFERKILRVVADDLGLTTGVTDGILAASERGIVTHASLMAGGLDFNRAADAARGAPGLGVGIHLTVTWGRPVTDETRRTNLVGRDGTFHAWPDFVRLFLLGAIAEADLRREWRAQIEKAKGAGLALVHADSHQHMHLLPGCLRVAASLCREFGIPYLRRPVERPHRTGSGKRLKMALFRRLCRRPWSLECADRFVGMALQGEPDFAARLQRVIEELPEGKTELMVHPGRVDAALLATDPYTTPRERELEALVDPALGALLAKHNIRLDRATAPALHRK